MENVVILIDTNTLTHTYKTVRVCVLLDSPIHNDEFVPVVRRVELDKVPAMLDKLEAKYSVSPTSHHREQYERLASRR